MAQVRYFVDDVDEAVAFYTGPLGFTLQKQYGAAMAVVTRGDLALWLAGPGSSAQRPLSDGAQPAPGGWNRIVLSVEGLDPLMTKLRAAGVRFRNEVVSGPGGRQTLCEDPSGNLLELFEPS